MKGKNVKTLIAELEKGNVLDDLRASIKSVYETASSLGIDKAQAKSVISSVAAEELPNKGKPSSKPNAVLNLDDLYRSYIDNQTLFPPEKQTKKKKRDVKYLVTSN